MAAQQQAHEADLTAITLQFHTPLQFMQEVTAACTAVEFPSLSFVFIYEELNS